ncbi:MAG: nucleotidyltransferase family protein [Steroidobacteraceae bacterium]
MSEQDSPALHTAILAAGPSTRFGSPKQLIRIGGTPVLHWAVSNAARAAGTSVTVVLGAHAAEIAPALKRSGASLQVNQGWREGLASSIRTAVTSAPPGCDGLLLMLADQVDVTAEDLRRLAAGWRRNTRLACSALYGGMAGLPAIFPSWAFPDLLGLRGEADPRIVLRRHSDRLVRIPMPSAATDVNTPEDLLAVAARGPARTAEDGDL